MFYRIEGEYVDGSLCVQAYEDDEPYATCSVCLVDYGITPQKGQIIVPTYKLMGEGERIVSDLADEVIKTVHFGPFNAEGTLIRLKSELINNGSMEC